MSPEQHQRVRDLFDRAIVLPFGERSLFLTRECGQDEALSREVRRMLEADPRATAGGFLANQALRDAPPDRLVRPEVQMQVPIDRSPTLLNEKTLATTVAPGAQETPLTEVGPYRLLEQIGSGGMGVVHKAQHLQTGDLVALKRVLVPNQALVLGMRREIRSLARLRHPGIVRVLDEGLHQGLPWYAMELLEGTPLSRYPLGRRAVASRQRCTWSTSCAPHWPICTAKASCIGISSRATSWSGPEPSSLPC